MASIEGSSNLAKRFYRPYTPKLGNVLDSSIGNGDGPDLSGPGFNPVDLSAIDNPGPLAKANPPDAANSLGLNIESVFTSFCSTPTDVCITNKWGRFRLCCYYSDGYTATRLFVGDGLWLCRHVGWF